MRELISLQIGSGYGKILVTRPSLRAGKTLQKLQQLGLETVFVPLSEIHASSAELPRINDIASVIVTSAASFFYLHKTYLQRILHLPFYCIGQETSKTAIAYGCKNIAAVVRDLDEFMANYINIKAPLLYLCGRLRRKNLEYKWVESNIDYRVAETYETVPCEGNINKLLAGDICLDAVSIVLLTSNYSAELCSLITPSLPPQVKYVCFSQRIAQALPKDLTQNIYICAAPDEENAIELIVRLTKGN